MKTKLRSLRNESWSACRTERKKTLARGDRGRDVAEDVDLGPARALRPVTQPQRHAAGLERGAHRPSHVDDRRPPPAALFVAEGGEPALQLRDRAVDRGQVLRWARGQRPVELRERPRRRHLLGPLDQGPLQLPAQVALERLDLLALERRRVALGVAGADLEAERAPDPLDVYADDPGALALAPEGGDREPAPRRASRRPNRGRSPAGSPLGADRGRAARRPRSGSARRSRARAPPARRRGRSSGRRASSNTRRSSCDFAIVAASASRKSAGSIQPTTDRASNASSSSAVPTGTPSARSSSQNAAMRGARPDVRPFVVRRSSFVTGISRTTNDGDERPHPAASCPSCGAPN